MSDLEEMFKDLESCCLHDPAWRPADVQKEVRWYGDRQTGSDSEAIVIVLLKDRQGYGLLTESEDYTGHGCQCSSFTAKAATLGELLALLDDWDLFKLIEQR